MCETCGCAQQAERSLQDEEALEERETVVVLREPEAMVIPEVCFSTEAQRDLGRMFTTAYPSSQFLLILRYLL